MNQNTVQKAAAKRLTKKRCTNSSCRRLFSVTDSEYIPGRCPYCGRLYPRINENYQIGRKKRKIALRRWGVAGVVSLSQSNGKEISSSRNSPDHLLWLLDTGKRPDEVISNLKQCLHIPKAEARSLADKAPILLGHFADRKRAHKIRGCLSKAGAAVWVGTLEDAPDVIFEEMDLSTKSYRCLKRAGFSELKDIVGMSVEDLLLVRFLGEKYASQVEREIGNQLLIQARRPK